VWAGPTPSSSSESAKDNQVNEWALERASAVTRQLSEAFLTSEVFPNRASAFKPIKVRSNDEAMNADYFGFPHQSIVLIDHHSLLTMSNPI